MRAPDRIRVLLVAPCFGAYGGIEAFVFAVAAAVARDPRFEIRICFKRVKHFALQRDLESYCRAADVVFCDRASPALWSQIAWADVVHGQNASPDVAVAAAVLRKPLAMTIHDFLPHGPRLRRLSWQFSARAASARWYNSNAVWATWEPRRRRDKSARIPTVSNLPSGFVEPSSRVGFVFVGRLVDSKGVSTLIDAYVSSGLDPIRWPLTIVGDGPLRTDLGSRAADTSGIRFTGFVSDDAKSMLMASAKWILAPSHAHEGLGLVVVEARHLGVPCIVSRHGGLPEAAGQDALICEPQDVRSLRAALTAAAWMTESEYEHRAERTKKDLACELAPLSFYCEAYLRLFEREPLANQLPHSVV